MMGTFSQMAGVHASKADDLTMPIEEENTTEARIAEALESIAHSLVALTLLELGSWDTDSIGMEHFRQGWRHQT